MRETKKKDFYEIFEDINTRAAIAFGIAMIALFLAIIALKLVV